MLRKKGKTKGITLIAFAISRKCVRLARTP